MSHTVLCINYHMICISITFNNIIYESYSKFIWPLTLSSLWLCWGIMLRHQILDTFFTLDGPGVRQPTKSQWTLNWLDVIGIGRGGSRSCKKVVIIYFPRGSILLVLWKRMNLHNRPAINWSNMWHLNTSYISMTKHNKCPNQFCLSDRCGLGSSWITDNSRQDSDSWFSVRQLYEWINHNKSIKQTIQNPQDQVNSPYHLLYLINHPIFKIKC